MAVALLLPSAFGLRSSFFTTSGVRRPAGFPSGGFVTPSIS
jgi:hypothetical protein